MELSPQLQEQIRQQLEAAKTALEGQKEELKQQPGNEDAKKDVAEKLGLISTLLLKYELGVIPSARREGVATALVRALEALARERGCYGMWVGVDRDNDPALATYRRAGARQEETPFVTFAWDFTARSG